MSNIDSMSWCLKNNIKIMIDATNKTRKPTVKLTISINGKQTEGQVEYKQDANLTETILELYSKLEKKLR
jgi:hypothetical protein